MSQKVLNQHEQDQEEDDELTVEEVISDIIMDLDAKKKITISNCDEGEALVEYVKDNVGEHWRTIKREDFIKIVCLKILVQLENLMNYYYRINT
jgi:hypothetical protein